MGSNAEERAAVFQTLSQAVIDITGTHMLQERRLRRSLEARLSIAATENPLGLDIDPGDLQAIEQLFSASPPRLSRYREAQLRELAFWRWVAFEGYGNRDPRLFPFHQQHLMLSTFYRTGWSRSEFHQSRLIELGCGPLGMIEFLPGRERVAFDPLNPAYARLFAHCRNENIRYESDRQVLADLPGGFDLAICHNVIDHTDDPAWWFDTLFNKLSPGGRFLIQVNLSRSDVPQDEEHRRMHPSPFSEARIRSWLRAKSSRHFVHLETEPSGEGEFYCLAWGSKDSDEPVWYENEFAKTVDPEV
ncbi:class I SAM-dependent methyltransferase [Enterovirga sp. CN4-39]|uniref:class I SAM-dependent methyltransferase n=1 Tax=Enterovirga sp. CN4-39 TaxID=3400910 RepID=UPI003BFB7B8C